MSINIGDRYSISIEGLRITGLKEVRDKVYISLEGKTTNEESLVCLYIEEGELKLWGKKL